VWPVATPLAALGLAMVMIGAMAIHLTQNEARVAALNFGLFLLAVFVVLGRIADPGSEQAHKSFDCHD
jgi:uncharacterized membrane protein YphA (DoxX/SURF4 family)